MLLRRFGARGQPPSLVAPFPSEHDGRRNASSHNAERMVSAVPNPILHERFFPFVSILGGQSEVRHSYAHNALVLSSAVPLLQVSWLRASSNNFRALIQGKAFPWNHPRLAGQAIWSGQDSSCPHGGGAQLLENDQLQGKPPQPSPDGNQHKGKQ